MRYVSTLGDAFKGCKATLSTGKNLSVQNALDKAIALIVKSTKAGKKVIFIGNGGSASIASHMAVDFWKNGRMKAVSFNDASQLTCLSNDMGYENVFSAPVEMFADKGDILIAISSSGRSANIIKAAVSAKKKGCVVVTFSGFQPDNPLRAMGDINFYIPDRSYGIVESAHAVLCHYILDTIME